MTLSAKRFVDTTFVALIIISLGVTPLFSQSTEVVDPLYRSYGVGQTGHISKLGVEISITPEISVKSGITGFLVQVTYKDPLIRSGEVVSLLHPTTFAASCEPRRRSQEHGPYERTNDRGTHFVVLLHQGCKDTKLGIPIPYLEASILCSDLARELRYIDAVASNKIFDISPTGFRQQVKTDIHDLVAVGRQAYDTYSVVSNVILVFSLISIAGEAITVEAFVLEALEGPGKEYLQGLVEGSLVEGAFDYVDSKYGLRVEFKLTGWEVVCRICHRKFHVESLKDGDLLRCPNGDAEARVFFH